MAILTDRARQAWFWVLIMAPALGHAQTTVYGSLGLAIRMTSNATNAGADVVAMTGTNAGTGILGVRGVEPIADGWRVRYRLESGFQPDTGALRNSAIFNREASLGIDTPYGKLDVGRLQHIGSAAESLVRADPLNGAGSFETVWPGLWTGARFDNAVRYRFEHGAAFASILLSFGEQPTAAGHGRVWALGAGYLGKEALATAFYQAAHDGRGLRAQTWTVGGIWRASPLSLHAAYMHATREKGFTIGAAAGMPLAGAEMAFAGIPAPAAQVLDFGLLGVTWQLAPNWRLRSAYFKARSRGATLFSTRGGGNQDTAYIALSNDLSRRTSLMMTVDWNHWRGGWAGFWGASPSSLAALTPDGSDTRRTLAAGLHHSF